MPHRPLRFVCPAQRRAEGERDLLAKIAELPEPDRAMAERLHAIAIASAPDLVPKTWCWIPACARYATFSFNNTANLDEGNM